MSFKLHFTNIGDSLITLLACFNYCDDLSLTLRDDEQITRQSKGPKPVSLEPGASHTVSGEMCLPPGQPFSSTNTIFACVELPNGGETRPILRILKFRRPPSKLMKLLMPATSYEPKTARYTPSATVVQSEPIPR